MLACLIESCLFPKGKHIHLAGRIVGTYLFLLSFIYDVHRDATNTGGP